MVKDTLYFPLSLSVNTYSFFLQFTRRSNPKFKPVRPFNYKTNNAFLSEFQLLLSNMCNVYKLFQVSIKHFHQERLNNIIISLIGLYRHHMFRIARIFKIEGNINNALNSFGYFDIWEVWCTFITQIVHISHENQSNQSKVVSVTVNGVRYRIFVRNRSDTIYFLVYFGYFFLLSS